MLAEVIHVKWFKDVYKNNKKGRFICLYVNLINIMVKQCLFFLILVDACEQQTKVKEEPRLHIQNGHHVAAEALLGMDSPQEENKTFLQDFLRQNQTKTSESGH